MVVVSSAGVHTALASEGPDAPAVAPSPTAVPVEPSVTPTAPAVPAPTPAATPGPTVAPPAPTAPAAASPVATPPAPTRAAPPPTAAHVAQATPEPTPAATPDPATCVFPESGTCEVHADQCSILGTPGPDTLLGGATADLICGLGGDDTIEGAGGDDTLIGGPGDDRLEGGSGNDCLLTGAGQDETPDFDPEQDLAVGQDPVEGHPVDPSVPRVEDDGRCRIRAEKGVDHGRKSRVAGGGDARSYGPATSELEDAAPVPISVRTGSLIVSIARLVEQDEAQQAGAFPVTLVPNARASDGVARMVLECPGGSYSGVLVLERNVAGRRLPAGQVRFTCAPPSALVTVRVRPAVRRRLDDSGSVRLTARIIVDGLAQKGAARLIVRADPG
jgi:hypothetical protein